MVAVGFTPLTWTLARTLEGEYVPVYASKVTPPTPTQGASDDPEGAAANRLPGDSLTVIFKSGVSSEDQLILVVHTSLPGGMIQVVGNADI
jgi:hypothetical protein